MAIGVAEAPVGAGIQEAAGALKDIKVEMPSVPEIQVADKIEDIALAGDTHGAIEAVASGTVDMGRDNISTPPAGPEMSQAQLDNYALENSKFGAIQNPSEVSSPQGPNTEATPVVNSTQAPEQPIAQREGFNGLPTEAPEVNTPAADAASTAEVSTGTTSAFENRSDAPSTPGAETSVSSTGDASTPSYEEPRVDADSGGTDRNEPPGDGRDGGGSGAESSQGPGEEEPADRVEESTSTEPEDKFDRAEFDDLKGKYDRGEDLTEEQMGRLNELRANDPDTQLAELEQKHKDGKITDITEYRKLKEMKAAKEARDNAETNGAEPAAEKTPEEQQKEIDELGASIWEKAAKGEYESVEDFENQTQELNDKMLSKTLKEQGFTPEQISEAVKRANEKNAELKKNHSKDIQDKIVELMSIEHRIMTIPAQVRQLREGRDKAMDLARGLHEVAQSKKADTPERLQAKAQEYNQYMVVDNYNENIQGTIHLADRLNQDRRNLEQQVRASLGVTGKWGAVMEWGANQVINVADELKIAGEDSVRWATGDRRAA